MNTTAFEIKNVKRFTDHHKLDFFGYFPKNSLKVGSQIKIYGTVGVNPTRFDVNLKCMNETKDHLILHFNPRFHEDEVVCNSALARGWGAEERHDISPFQPGKTFFLCILCEAQHFNFHVNGIPHSMYRYREDVTSINVIEILKDVDIHAIYLS